MALPVLRAAAARRRLDLALLAVRVALLGALARGYARRGAAFWLSPLADPATAACLTLAALRPARSGGGGPTALRRAEQRADEAHERARRRRRGSTGSKASCTSGKPKTPARAPHANARATAVTADADGQRRERGERRERERRRRRRS